MVYIIVESKNALTGDLIVTLHYYNSYSELIKDRFPPGANTVWLLNTDEPPKGKTYNTKKKRLRSKAYNLQYLKKEYPQLTGYSVMNNIADYFYKHGKRYGLLKEFKNISVI